MSHRIVAVLILCISASTVRAQEDLLTELQKNEHNEVAPVIQTFKGTRLVNGHSIETKPGGALEFIFAHRFGTLNSGSYNFFGLDESYVRLGLEYGITDRLGLAIGRTSTDKTYDSYLKYKLLRQRAGVPFTITLLGGAYAKTSKNETVEIHGPDRLAFSSQMMIARKFSQAFSLQASPTFLHRNAVDQTNSVNDLIAVGLGAKIRITRSLSFHGEYYARLNEKSNNPNTNPVGFAFDIETGGHVFQLIFTNTRGMNERSVLTETTGDFFKGDIHYGFNITRTFQLTNKKVK
jgi:hypothetical protein